MKLLRCSFRRGNDNSPDEQTIRSSHPKPAPMSGKIAGDDVLVFLSDSGVLSFISYEELDQGRGKFSIVKELYLAPPGLGHKYLGRSLCVDPLSRALAVAAWQDLVKVYMLTQHQSRENFEPIKEERLLEVKGIIWNMAFLYPTANEKERLLLALVVFDDVEKSASIMLYQFWSNEPLQKAELYGKLPLGKDFPLPLHLVPLPHHPETFLLINERQISFLQADDITCGNVNYYKLNLPPTYGTATEAPLITSYALPSELPPLSSGLSSAVASTQYLYLGTDKGDLYKVLVTGEPYVELQLLGKLNPIGEAMHVIATNDQQGDLLAISGEMANGSVVTVDHFNNVNIRAEILNWSPVLDFVSLDYYNEQHDSLYLCCGGSLGGSIREIRNGVGVTTIVSTGADFGSANRLWSLKTNASDVNDSFLVISFVHETRLMYSGGWCSEYVLTDSWLAGELEDVSDRSGFDLEQSTIGTGVLHTTGYLVQICHRAVIVTHPNLNDDELASSSAKWTSPDGATITVGFTVENNVILGLSSNQTHSLVMLAVNIDPSTIVAPFPICLIGTYKPSIEIYGINSTFGFELLHSESLASYSSEGINIPQSTAFVGTEQMHFLAGLRDGTIIQYSWSWSTDVGKPILTSPSSRKIGVFPVQIIYPQNRVHSNYVLVFSDRAWKIISTSNGLAFDSISFNQPEQITAATSFADGSECDGYLTVTKNVLNYVYLDSEKRNNVRYIAKENTPRRILYDKLTEKFLIACNVESSSRPTTMLKLIEPLSGEALAEQRMREQEIVYSLCVWNIPGKRKYRYICVGTGIHDAGSIPHHGRLLIYNIKKNPPRKQAISEAATYELKLVWENERAGAVYSVCPYEDGYLLVAAGKTLYMFYLDLNLKKLVECCKISIRSPVVSISVQGSWISVGTQKDSVLFYTFDKVQQSLEFVRGARHLRLVANSKFISEKLSVGTDKLGTVFGMTYDEESVRRPLNDSFAFNQGETTLRLNIGSMVYESAENCAYKRLGWSETTGESEKNKPSIIGCSIIGSVVLYLRLDEKVFSTLEELQTILAKHPCTRPLLGNNHYRFRSLVVPAKNVIDGEMVSQFLLLPYPTKMEIIQASCFFDQVGQDLADRSTQEIHPNDAERTRHELVIAWISQILQELNQHCN
ncbi:hypothetical protein K493DRAFT_334751 [Basidiobolus meristosporus CBS 931.73]|uniref:DNA damage-binding protein 1 n=1 Tax=Basidiobolus meristosporus CBS 931.73 TaxID=1314790 RepID=A0A1Y1YVP8_9FUNG|nr:hypothetical protein K493DRAFT_334751 [Basidiobolus meristosporus CBS 931.73]|eukprot:ORY02118.1 hypothetical protein K493DRAFT_334751 [Basidiobolus meristosporus CBS 931.73]